MIGKCEFLLKSERRNDWRRDFLTSKWLAEQSTNDYGQI